MLKQKYNFVRTICPFLPPIMSQTVRKNFVTIDDGVKLDMDFTKKSFTGSLFHGNTSDFHAFKFSVHGYFDWRNIIISNEVLKFKSGNIIEVGANIGTETISFADIANKHQQKVFAFEPVPANVDSIRANLAFNKLSNVELFSCLVSDMPGTASFKVPTKNDSGSGHITSSTSEGDVQEFKVVTLDEQLQDHVISLISIDVEGFEYQVLRGAARILQMYAPVLIVEVNKNYLESRAKISLKEFYDYLTDNNYECFYVAQMGLQPVDINNFQVKPNKNWVCISKNDPGLHVKISKAIKLNSVNPFFNSHII